MKISTIAYTDENYDYLWRQKYVNKADAKTIVNKLLDESRRLKREFGANKGVDDNVEVDRR